MEIDLMFCAGFNPTHSQKLADWITKNGRVNWSQIEAQIFSQGFKRDKLAQAMYFYSISSPKTILPLSGPLLVLTRKKAVLDFIDLFLESQTLIAFAELRLAVWMSSNDRDHQSNEENYWLDIEFYPSPSPGDGPQYRAELRVLDHKMNPYPTSF